MSKRTFARFVKKRTDNVFLDLLHLIRIQHAVELLKTSDDSITGIGYSVGFETRDFFFLVFKRIMGMTPSEFRASADCLNRQS